MMGKYRTLMMNTVAWGHGSGKGVVVQMALVQQGPGNDNTSGNTVLNFQVGMRLWRG